MRAFELETIDGFERYSTTSKSYAVLKVQYFEALVTRSARIMQILKTTRVSNYNLDVMVICLVENINEHYKHFIAFNLLLISFLHAGTFRSS